MAKKAKQKKANRGAKKVKAKAKLNAKKKKASKRKATRKPMARRGAGRQPEIVFGSQNVETVHLKRPTRAAAAGAGGGDFGGASVVETVDSESADELLEEGQAFEAGIVSGVENAPDADKAEVRTREVSQDDVPEEYDDKDRP